MTVVIIEDERMVAEDLADSIAHLFPEASDIVQLHSVRESIAWFNNHPSPELIFSDIQLGDGLSFAIFKAVSVSVPVIFCTAYDQYAIDAFKANGIDYVLKPYTLETLESALNRYQELKKQFAINHLPSHDAVMQLLSSKAGQQAHATSILVYMKDKIIPIELKNIALIYLENNIVHLQTFSGKVFYPNKNLDELEKITGNFFFRANRQILIARKSIADVSSFFSRRLSLNLTVPFAERITVSKLKTPAFLEWLSRA